MKALVLLFAAVAPEQLEFFEKEIRPLLAEYCYNCHSAKAKIVFGELRLDDQVSASKAIVQGKPAESKLIKAVKGELPMKMPPTGSLRAEQVAALEKWVGMGAPWSENATAAVSSGGFDLQGRKKEHWAWQPVKRVEPPVVRDTSWPIQPLDRFVLAQLEARGLKPAAPATRAALVRRLYFDVTGLPPTAEQIARSEKLTHEELVDSLLESPQYGERMARRWMDVIRYSESHGSEGDPDTPQAWRYRDYLIRAFNADVPYDQLIREHLAGDLLPAPRINAAEKLNESVIGAAHLRMVEHGFQPVDPWEDRVKWMDNQIDVFSKAFQGLTISCARCHDHKFDAISQKDFYALFGIFYGARPTQVAIDSPEVLNKNREELARLKKSIKLELAGKWRTEARDLERKATGEAVELDASKFTVLFDPARKGFAQWTRHGVGAPPGPSRTGEFQVEPEGERAVSGIYPAGVYSGLLSRKHSAVIATPRFRIESDSISFQMAGGNFATANLIIENYAVPRSGIYSLRYTAKSNELRWVTWDARFWKGFTAYIEFATRDDVTHFMLDDEDNKLKRKPGADHRSWFGVGQILAHGGDWKPAGERAVQGDLGEAIDAWSADRMTDEQAALLDHFVRKGLLSNKADSQLVAEYRRLEGEIAIPRRAPGVVQEASPPQPLLVRGSHKNFGETVPMKYLTALESKPFADLGMVRLRLAEEIASAANPLTARVIANRLWQYAFRRGIVRTVDNFGKLGEKPTHPELLDWLAGRLVEEGWSVKKMMRLLLTSRTYRMSSQVNPADASNDLFSHVPVRRLEAEEIRDAVLVVSKQLDRRMYGESVPVYYSHETGATKGDRPKGPVDGNGRRSVYLEIRRNATNPFLEVFDVYKPTTTRGQRDVTNVPAQSLALMNSPFVIDQAAKWAKLAPAVEAMYLDALGRGATAAERDRAETYAAEGGLASLAQAIFNLKEFLYVQ